MKNTAMAGNCGKHALMSWREILSKLGTDVRLIPVKWTEKHTL